MANSYDKVLKENIESLILPLTDRLFGFKLRHWQRMTEKFQTTVEREPDFLSEVVTEDGEEFILQIEFQTKNDPMMPYRMMEYHAMLAKKHKKEIRQFVVYLGAKNAKIPTSPPPQHLFTGYTIRKIGQIDYHLLVGSNVPEEVMLAMLSDFGKQPKEEIVRSIVDRLLEISDDVLNLQKYLYQLGVLSRIKKLEHLTFKIVTSMPITIDYTKDFLYKTALKKGLELGEERGEMLTLKKVIKSVSKNSPQMSDEEIAKFLGVKVDIVKKVRTDSTSAGRKNSKK